MKSQIFLNVFINLRISKEDKEYYHYQFNEFVFNARAYGFNGASKEDIIKKGLSFNPLCISNGSTQYDKNLKRFEKKNELLGFVVGYNTAIQKMKY
tara:strand:- start:344 stop:631 length:288 start_codon:yes stop_codon:yes gene_type:complete